MTNLRAEELESIFASPEKFKETVKDFLTLMSLATKHPDFKDRLIEYVLNDPDEFNRLIKNSTHLASLAKEFPNHRQKIIERVLTDEVEFTRLVKRPSDLKILATEFPGNAKILNQTTIADAVAMITNIKLSGPYTQGAAAGFFTAKNIPLEIGSHIGTFLDRKDGARLARTTKMAAETAKGEQEHARSRKKTGPKQK